MQNTHGNLPRERKAFFNFFWACFGFEFANFVPDACLAERKPRCYKCVSRRFGTTRSINVKITCEGVLLLIKFQADVLQNNKNNTSPDEFLTFCNETNDPKSKNASYVMQNYIVFFIYSFEEVLVTIDWKCPDDVIFFQVVQIEAIVWRCSWKFHKIHRKTPVPESLF